MTLAELVYRDTAGFPREEVFGLTTQARKSAVSVPSNIAEGAGRNTTPELVHFLGISCGSLAELDTQLELAVRLGYLKADSGAIKQINRVGKIVRLLRGSLREKLQGKR